MIRLTGGGRFGNDAEWAKKERTSVRRHGAGCYEVTDKAKGHTYLVRFTRADGATFGTCACEAGTPRRGRTPMICEHLFAAVVTHDAIAAMRRAPEALAAGEAYDGND